MSKPDTSDASDSDSSSDESFKSAASKPASPSTSKPASPERHESGDEEPDDAGETDEPDVGDTKTADASSVAGDDTAAVSESEPEEDEEPSAEFSKTMDELTNALSYNMSDSDDEEDYTDDIPETEYIGVGVTHELPETETKMQVVSVEELGDEEPPEASVHKKKCARRDDAPSASSNELNVCDMHYINEKWRELLNEWYDDFQELLKGELRQFISRHLALWKGDEEPQKKFEDRMLKQYDVFLFRQVRTRHREFSEETDLFSLLPVTPEMLSNFKQYLKSNDMEMTEERRNFLRTEPKTTQIHVENKYKRFLKYSLELEVGKFISDKEAVKDAFHTASYLNGKMATKTLSKGEEKELEYALFKLLTHYQSSTVEMMKHLAPQWDKVTAKGARDIMKELFEVIPTDAINPIQLEYPPTAENVERLSYMVSNMWKNDGNGRAYEPRSERVAGSVVDFRVEAVKNIIIARPKGGLTDPVRVVANFTIVGDVLDKDALAYVGWVKKDSDGKWIAKKRTYFNMDEMGGKSIRSVLEIYPNPKTGFSTNQTSVYRCITSSRRGIPTGPMVRLNVESTCLKCRKKYHENNFGDCVWHTQPTKSQLDIISFSKGSATYEALIDRFNKAIKKIVYVKNMFFTLYKKWIEHYPYLPLPAVLGESKCNIDMLSDPFWGPWGMNSESAEIRGLIYTSRYMRMVARGEAVGDVNYTAPTDCFPVPNSLDARSMLLKTTSPLYENLQVLLSPVFREMLSEDDAMFAKNLWNEFFTGFIPIYLNYAPKMIPSINVCYGDSKEVMYREAIKNLIKMDAYAIREHTCWKGTKESARFLFDNRVISRAEASKGILLDSFYFNGEVWACCASKEEEEGCWLGEHSDETNQPVPYDIVNMQFGSEPLRSSVNFHDIATRIKTEYARWLVTDEDEYYVRAMEAQEIYNKLQLAPPRRGGRCKLLTYEDVRKNYSGGSAIQTADMPSPDNRTQIGIPVTFVGNIYKMSEEEASEILSKVKPLYQVEDMEM